MPNFTTNLNLEKPLTNENYNIEVFNANADKLDTAIKEVSSKVDNFEAPVKSVNGKTGAVTLAATDIKTTDGKTLEEFKTTTSSQLDTKANLVEGKVPIEEIPGLDYVPTTRTVNGKSLSNDITLVPKDLGIVSGFPNYLTKVVTTYGGGGVSITDLDTLNNDYVELIISATIPANAYFQIINSTTSTYLYERPTSTSASTEIIRVVFWKGKYGVQVINTGVATNIAQLLESPTSINSSLARSSTTNLVLGTSGTIGRVSAIYKR